MISPASLINPYQVGGSLPPQAPSYVQRQADAALLNALRLGQLCYLTTPRAKATGILRRDYSTSELG